MCHSEQLDLPLQKALLHVWSTLSRKPCQPIANDIRGGLRNTKLAVPWNLWLCGLAEVDYIDLGNLLSYPGVKWIALCCTWGLAERTSLLCWCSNPPAQRCLLIISEWTAPLFRSSSTCVYHLRWSLLAGVSLPGTAFAGFVGCGLSVGYFRCPLNSEVSPSLTVMVTIDWFLSQRPAWQQVSSLGWESSKVALADRYYFSEKSFYNLDRLFYIGHCF